MAFILLPCHFGFLSAALKMVAQKYVIGFIRALKMKQKSNSCILKQRHSRLNRLKEWGIGIIPLHCRYQCPLILLKLTTKMTLGPWAIALGPDGSLHSTCTSFVRECQPWWPAGDFVKMNHIMLQLEKTQVIWLQVQRSFPVLGWLSLAYFVLWACQTNERKHSPSMTHHI